METPVSGKKGGKRARKHLNQLAALKRWQKAQGELLGPSSSNSDVEIRPIESEECVDPNTSQSPESRQPASERKLSLLKADENLESPSSRSWCLAELGQINQLLARAICPSCWCETLQLKKEAAQACKGFSEPLILFCTNSHCNYSSETVYSSPKIQDTSRQAYEVNSLMTMYATEIGKGHSALQKLQQFFDISTMNYSSYKVHLDKLKNITQMSTDMNLELAAQKIKTANESGLCDDNVTNVTVSFDGRWQKRGFSSKLGVGVAIEVQTGLVVDFEVLSTYCHACCLAVNAFKTTMQL